MSGYQTGADNQMTRDGTYTYTYDAVGNLTQKSKGTGQETWFYTYDNRNELTVARDTSNGTTTITLATYSYDVQGHRVQEQLWQTGGSTTTTRFAYDGNNVWADLDGSNVILVRYEYGDGADQTLTRTVASGSSVGAYLSDNLGSVRDLVNWSGAVVDHLDYSGYGVLTLESNAGIGDRFKYDGYQFETTVGLYYVNARWYDPATGRWTQVDPAGFGAGDRNLYRYVGNHPTNDTDPTGLVTLPNPGIGDPGTGGPGIGGPGTPPAFILPQLLPPTTVLPRNTGSMVGKNGQFTWGVQLKLDRPSGAKGGLIVQRVQRKVLFFNGLNGKFNKKTTLAQDYYEVWPVPPNSEVPSTKTFVTFISGNNPKRYGEILKANGFNDTDTVDDIFSGRPITHGANIAGAVIMRASLWYIDGDSNRPPGFRVDPTASAGLIPILHHVESTANFIKVRNLFRTAEANKTLSQPVWHAAIATWDRTGKTTLSTYPEAPVDIPNVNMIDCATLTNLYEGNKISLFDDQVQVFGPANDTSWWR